MKILQYPHSLLTTPCKPADFSDWKPIASAIGDLTAGMNLTRKAVGLSAPQVGSNLRIFILDVAYLQLHGVSKIFINPVVTEKSSLEDVQDEACMSLPPGVLIPVKRPISCTVEASNKEGHRFEVKLTGLAARAAQHEVEHLDGRTILDHAPKKQKRMAMQKIILAMKKRR